MRKITNEEIAFFDKNGYVICRDVLHEEELHNFQAESQRLIDEILAGEDADRKCTRGPERIPYYLTYLHANPNNFSLRLLAHPFVGDLLTRTVGPDFIPCFEALVFKLPGNGSSVPWHRDGKAESGNERIFNIDIYPDHSTVDNSCVWVIPGSHMWPVGQADEMVARGKERFDLPDAVPAEVTPGDVLLHHTRVLHGSTVNTSDTLRRVVYFDNRSVSWNRKYQWFDESVMTRRSLLYQHALHVRREHPYDTDDESFSFDVPAELPVWCPGDPTDLHVPRVPPQSESSDESI
jgi:phytanoyl-CoA hydroxylase